MSDRPPASGRPGLARATAPTSDVVALGPVRRQRAIARKRGRDAAIVLVADAMRVERADYVDVGEGLGIHDRCARRILSGEAPLEIGDLIALARSGRGGARLARAVLRRLELAVDAAVDDLTPLRQHG